MELLTASKLSLWIRKILVALICFNGLVILYVNVPNLFTKSSFIEKVRFNIPLSWQQFQKPPPDGYHELAIEQEKMYQLKDFPRVPEGKILDPDDFKYELYRIVGMICVIASVTGYFGPTTLNFENPQPLTI